MRAGPQSISHQQCALSVHCALQPRKTTDCRIPSRRLLRNLEPGSRTFLPGGCADKEWTRTCLRLEPCCSQVSCQDRARRACNPSPSSWLSSRALYFGRDVFVPLALAGLLSFALAPLIAALRRRGIPRTPAVLTVVIARFPGHLRLRVRRRRASLRTRGEPAAV